MAESEGFEPPIDLRLCLISSQVHSTGLCQLSVYKAKQINQIQRIGLVAECGLLQWCQLWCQFHFWI
jgi:hypothetical protein